MARYVIDEDLCIGCGLCRETAPENIGETELYTSRVFRQPTSHEEEAACRDASEFCPTGALAPEAIAASRAS